MNRAPESEVRFDANRNEIKPQQPNKKNRAIIMTVILSLGTVYCGYTIAYIVALGTANQIIIYGNSVVIPVVKAFMIASLPFGITLGTFLSPWVLPLATRRNLVIILSLIGLVAEGIIQIQELAVFYVVRFMQGTLIGLFFVLTPVYIRQISPRQLSSHIKFGVFEKLFVLLGFVIPFSYNTILLKKDVDQVVRWRIVVTLNSLPLLALILLSLIGFIPESPNSLIETNRHEQAKQVIALYHPNEIVDEVYAFKLQQRQNLAKAHPNTALTQKKKSKLKTFLTFEIPIIHQMTGVNAYISQMGFVISQYNFGFSEYVPLLMTCVQFITLCISVFYISKVSSRKILLIGNCGMSLCCFAIGISLIFIKENRDILWCIVPFLVSMFAFNGGTFIPSIGLYIAEVGSKNSIRWSLVVNWLVSACTILIFVMVSSRFGFPTVFITFGTISMIGFIFNIFCMIETRQKLKRHIHIQLKPKLQNKKQSAK